MIEQLIQQAQPYWKQYVEHEFVQQLAKGTLPKACFQHYLKQDYIYLFHYSRAFALGVFKAKNFTDMEMPRKTLDILCQEIQLHLDYCRQWEISEQEIFQTPESAACISYTRYLLDCGMTGGLPELYAAVTPCALGYAQVARYITENKRHKKRLIFLPHFVSHLMIPNSLVSNKFLLRLPEWKSDFGKWDWIYHKNKGVK